VNIFKDAKEAYHDKKAEIPKMAEDAEKAIEGPEGDALRRAEETGRSRAKH